MAGWNDFFVAMGGASVAFAGLVLVSISINLDRIVRQPGLVGRAAVPLIVLFTLFVSASVILIPGQRTWFYGLELLIVVAAFAVVAGIVLGRQRDEARRTTQQGLTPRRSFLIRVMLCAVTASFLLLAGIVLLFGRTGGAYFLAPAIIVGFLLAFLEAWVLLIEIDR